MFSNLGTHSVFGSQPAQQQSSWLNTPTPLFGSSFGTPATTTTMFGNSSQNSSTLFGSQMGTNFSTGVMNTNQAGTPIVFKPILSSDTIMKNGVTQSVNTRLQCVSCMKEYENKSLEELRLEDYQLNRKGKPETMFGGIQPQKMFGGIQPQQSMSVFAPATTTQSSIFGQTASPFGTTPTGSIQPKTGFGNLFSNQQTTPFGGGAANTNAFSSFGNTQRSTNVFGSNSPATSTTNAFGAGTFNFLQPQQQQSAFGGSLFGQKPITTSTTSNLSTFKPFAQLDIFNTPTSTQNTFGTPTQFNPGTGGRFGNHQQNKGFNFGSFGAQQSQPAVASTSAFGAPTFNFTPSAASTPVVGSTFGNPAPAFGTAGTGSTFGTPAPAFGVAGTGSTFGTPAPAFGAVGTGTTFGNSGPTLNNIGNNFSFGNNPTLFGPSATGVTSFGGFGAPQNFSFGHQLTNSGFGAPSVSAQQNFIPQEPVFGLSLSSPLLYNLVVNRSIDALTKPTDPREQFVIRTASKLQSLNRLTPSETSKNFESTLPRSPLFMKTKKCVFDGFEDDLSSGIDILAPKSSYGNCKTLSLNAVRCTERVRTHKIPSFIRDGSSISATVVVNENIVEQRFDGESASELLDESATSSVENDSEESFVSSAVDHQSTFQESSSPDSRSVNQLNEPKPTPGFRCNLASTRPGYYVHPALEDLDFRTDEMGNCFEKGFVVGRHNYGKITFLDVVNVAGIDIDDTVFFSHKEVMVYPDDNKKPPVGEGLNCPAEIVLERVWPIDKETRGPIQKPAMLQELKYEMKLRRACDRQDAEFVSYDEESGTWTFRVKHFSSYNFENEEDP